MVVTKYAPNTVCHWSVWWTRMIMPVLNSGDIADEDSPYQYVMHELERRLRWGGCTCWSHRGDRSTSHTVHLQHVKMEYCTLNTTTGGFYHREDRSTSHTVHLQHVKTEYCTLNTTTGGLYQITPITRTSNEQQVKRTLNHSTIQSDLWNTNIYSQGSTTIGMTYQIVNIMPGEDLLSWPREHDHLNITKTASTQVTPLLEWQHLHSM